MLLNLTFTLLSNNLDEEGLIAETVKLNELINKQFKEKSLEVVKSVAGVHKNAARLHSHSGVQVKYDAKDEVKFWNKKVISIVGYKSQDFDLKISVWRESDAGFDAQCLLGYPLKEMENLENWPFLEISKGVCKEEIEEMRDWAHQLYVKASKERERNEERKKIEDTEGEQIAAYLKDATNPRKMGGSDLRHMNVAMRLLVVKTKILCYYKKRHAETGKRGFRTSGVREMAVHFLLYENFAEEVELAELL